MPTLIKYQGMIRHEYLQISKVLDGDTLVVTHLVEKMPPITVRLIGIDAPETRRSQKLVRDEMISRTAAGLLLKFGNGSLKKTLDLAPPGTKVALYQEKNPHKDPYGRSLGYIILPSGKCLNEELIRDGYAKPYIHQFCRFLPDYRHLNALAIQNKTGHYAIAPAF